MCPAKIVYLCSVLLIHIFLICACISYWYVYYVPGIMFAVGILFNRIGWDHQFIVPESSVATSLAAGWSLSGCRWIDLCRYGWMRQEINGGTGSRGCLLSLWYLLCMSLGARILLHVEIYCNISYYYNYHMHIFVFYLSHFYLPHMPFYLRRCMF